ncbi:hypothetical protein BC940DRAFT_304750 [Gongronella butleri]|nr:hypothetical protein BC940DRAFT_304750 [Gongronella butleri]
MRFLISLLVALCALLAFVSATDYRLDYRPKKGESVAQFCKLWPAECQKVAFKHHYRGTVNSICERSPRKGVAQAFCTSEYKYETVQYTKEVAKDLGATFVY